MARFEAAPVAPPAAPFPTGFYSLDAALGGGLPRGRIVELFGPPCGKTTLLLQIAAHAQERGAGAAWIDADHSFDPAYAAALGVDLGRMAVVRPESAEQAIEMGQRLAESGAIELLVLDSAAALVPQLELEAGVGDQSPGLQSRVLAWGLRRLAGVVLRSGTVVAFLNQTRTRKGPDGADIETSAAGPPLKMHAAVRVELGPGADGRVRFRVLKNRAAAAFATGDLVRAPGAGFVKSP
jgi:recombination protein RecA